MPATFELARRSLLAAVLAAPFTARAATPADRRLTFTVLRNGAKVGEHLMRFSGGPGETSVITDVTMTIKLGPVTVYRYAHHAEERWAGGRFATLETTTNGNGKRQHVSARRSRGGLDIVTERGPITAPADALPFTHWNPDVFGGPLFNPQEGKVLRLQPTHSGREAVTLADGRRIDALRWSVRGEAEIDDFYDEAGVWVALRGRLPDRSRMEYRRI